MKYLLLLCIGFFFIGCSSSTVNLKNNNLYLKTNKENTVLISPLRVNKIGNRCLHNSYRAKSKSDKYGMLDIEHTELRSNCHRNSSYNDTIEKIINSANKKDDKIFKKLLYKKVDNYEFYRYVSTKHRYNSSVDKNHFNFIVIKDMMGGHTLIRDYFGILIEELLHKLQNKKQTFLTYKGTYKENKNDIKVEALVFGNSIFFKHSSQKHLILGYKDKSNFHTIMGNYELKGKISKDKMTGEIYQNKFLSKFELNKVDNNITSLYEFFKGKKLKEVAFNATRGKTFDNGNYMVIVDNLSDSSPSTLKMLFAKDIKKYKRLSKHKALAIAKGKNKEAYLIVSQSHKSIHEAIHSVISQSNKIGTKYKLMFIDNIILNKSKNAKTYIGTFLASDTECAKNGTVILQNVNGLLSGNISFKRNGKTIYPKIRGKIIDNVLTGKTAKIDFIGKLTSKKITGSYKNTVCSGTFEAELLE